MNKWHIEEKDGYNLVINKGGAVLSYDPNSGKQLLIVDGFAFKDLNGNGILDPYEDWRLPIKQRVADLLSQMDTDDCLSMMLHAGMFIVQKITPEALEKNPSLRARLAVNGKSIEEFMKDDFTQLSPDQLLYIDDGLRFWLISAIEDAGSAAKFINNVQRLLEKSRLGIPGFFSTNPRAFTDAHSDIGEKDVSSWPTNLGLGASFDPSVGAEMANTVKKEYRSMGIVMELGPQIDVATDPRWNRFNATYGSDSFLTRDMAKAIIDAYQTSTGDAEIEDGWGSESIMTMTKHWPGSTGEGGRESHSYNGRFAVYPGNNFSKRVAPWVDGAFKLDGPTKQCAAVMGCYDILYGINDGDINGGDSKNVGVNFSRYAIHDLLREENDFSGYACTDFWITGGQRLGPRLLSAWGMLDNTPEERALAQMEAGIDQLGGLGEFEIIKKAYIMACEKHGKDWAEKRIREAAGRILPFCFGIGYFENPYRCPEEADKIVGSEKCKERGLSAHRKSLVLLKNDDVLPASGKKVYIANKFSGGIPDRGGNVDPITSAPAFSRQAAGEFFTVVDLPDEADFALVLMDSPQSGNGTLKETGEVIPISLQYEDYTATAARENSIGGDIIDGVKENLSYRGKTVKTYNKYDLDVLRETCRLMKDKPIVVVLRCTNPVVPSEFEPVSSAVLISWGNTPEKIIMEALAGCFEPGGLLPFQMPADMEAVERHFEDTPRDIAPYIDSAGNAWDFAYGMNYSGIIYDERVKKYRDYFIS
ncbi:MAG: glycoside hydrolase family 3 N-terminal domain-containing protein [Lachnospiraceae bacterium]